MLTKMSATRLSASPRDFQHTFGNTVFQSTLLSINCGRLLYLKMMNEHRSTLFNGRYTICYVHIELQKRSLYLQLLGPIS